ncbi:MAG: [FeFe] hydrogenase H-cluster radical SAM maturase HydG [Candidatus Marinimicrobia bacterium]|nr:[FeFe] hydrogenase H-cluster radical SAM maturase HydG [Candidatus Neomarinimicrobiota bacterium]
MYELSKNAMDFINDEYLEGLLKNTKPDEFRVREILDKSLSKEPLNVEETAVLLNAEDRELQEEILETARKLKREVYGNRIVLFAPLYIGNYCINNCQYCGFRISNRNAVRRTLTDDEVKEQVIALESRGHKRLILVWGEHPMYSPEQIAKTVRIVYSTKSGKGEIRRVNINAAPQTVEGYRIIKEAGIGTFQVFQETYHHETYKKFHPGNTPKSDYLYRLDALDRAMEGGIDDVGIGALFGLYNWKFEVLGLVSHAIHLQKKYGVGPHTISFPRIRPALGVEMDYPYIVNDEDFKRMVAILRISVPYTGLILTAREKPELRREVMAFGVSQIDAGSRIEIGGYTEAGDAQNQYIEKEQFELGDIRPLDVVMRELMQDEYVPSFCTACYRIGRTGEHFMEFAIPGFIKRFCTPNALLTLMEYLVDYASEETREVGENLIKKELKKMDDDGIKKSLIERLDTIKTTNKRDLYY